VRRERKRERERAERLQRERERAREEKEIHTQHTTHEQQAPHIILGLEERRNARLLDIKRFVRHLDRRGLLLQRVVALGGKLKHQLPVLDDSVRAKLLQPPHAVDTLAGTHLTITLPPPPAQIVPPPQPCLRGEMTTVGATARGKTHKDNLVARLDVLVVNHVQVDQVLQQHVVLLAQQHPQLLMVHELPSCHKMG